jgi:hypothetical protein
MEAILEEIQIMKDRFINRYDIYPIQTETGWHCVKQPLTHELIEAHLRHEKTIGVYPGADSTCKWGCFDIDLKNETLVREVYSTVREKIPCYIEFSGYKGYHIWTFFKEPTPNRIIREIARSLLKQYALKVEVFPKQDITTKENPGNLVKLPLGIHKLSGKECLFVNENIHSIQDQWQFLKSIEKVDAHNLIENSKDGVGQPKEGKTNYKVKSCVLTEITEGTERGNRNVVAHIIATEMRRTSRDIKFAEGVLLAWNLRNKPPLPKEEVLRTLDSAYNSGVEYGCNEDGALRRVLRCVGKSKCNYYRQRLSGRIS